MKEHAIELQKIDNYNRKNFIKRYNDLLQIVAFSIVKHPEKKLHENQIKKHIIGKFLLSEVASRRYLNALKSSDAFKVVDNFYMLPDDVEHDIDG